MCSALMLYPNLHALFVGTPQGGLIEVGEIGAIGTRRYLSKSNQQLPAGISYVAREVHQEGKERIESWYYLDKSFQLVDKESFSTGYEVTSRPWYRGAVEQKGLFWTDVYDYQPTSMQGITVSSPIYTSKKELVAVTGIDLPISALEQFFVSQKVGKRGKSYLVNSDGRVIIPHAVNFTEGAILEQALQEHRETKKNNFSLEYQSLSYLIHLENFPAATMQKWMVIVVVPLEDFFSEIFRTRRQAIGISLAILGLTSLLVYYLAKRISQPIVELAQEIDQIKHLHLDSEKRVNARIYEVALLDSSVASMRKMLRSFEHYVPTEIVRQLLEKEEDISLGGEKKEIAILFSDIADFTPMAESLPIEEVLPSLSAYFECLTQIILDTQGTVDKYIGDGIMAFWGAPTDVDKPAIQACTAALRCQAAIGAFNQQQKREGKPVFYTRFGINIGAATVGYIGTKERMNYTAMGDAVNEAARLQQASKIYETPILISGHVAAELTTDFLTRPLDEVALKGKRAPTKIYELVGKYDDPHTEIAPNKEKAELCRLFTQAYEVFRKGDYSQAKQLFRVIRDRFPNDFPAKLYLTKIDSDTHLA
jgi:adenylate cyclase